MTKIITFVGMMTRLRKYLFTLVLLALCLTDAQAQFKIYTRKARMADFPAKTTMVVLSGNDLLDIALKNEIKSRWRVSPFDFCYIDEINEIKKNSNFYILYLSTEKSGLVYLNLEKCGEKESFSSLNSRMDIVKVPFGPKEFSTGREIYYLSAMIDIMQHYVENSLIRKHSNFSGLEKTHGSLIKERKKKLYIAREDLSSEIPGRDSIPNPGDGLIYTDGFTVDSLFTASSSNAIIGFCISSNSPSPNSESYQVIVSADRHELLYYKRRRYKDGAKRGFTSKELKAIQAEHAYRK